ncbi:helix-turn-helix domain-containing protein [Streptomyces sp. NPDC046862]|uniref:helix-turn-helix domain-containing protein n=1 Tax=Streptomyces sp. NPDC046862 TaxID=3154603 RepID=UPI00345466F4
MKASLCHSCPVLSGLTAGPAPTGRPTQRNLGEPELSPRAIAEAPHTSVSHLHRLFQDHGTTVSTLIRRHRLEHARRDLIDPRLRDVPVHRIAAR